MAKKTYRKQDSTDWGWFTTVPFPLKKTAEFVANQKMAQFDEVVVEKKPNGFIVKYRGPRK